MFSTALWTRNVRTFALFVVGRAEAPLLPAAMAGALEQKSTLGCDVFISTKPPPTGVVHACLEWYARSRDCVILHRK